MIFRFTLTHRGSESGPIALPALSLWSTNVGADEEWAEGSTPSVTLAGAFPTVVSSEYLYVDYGFISGNEYTITLEYNVEYNSGNSNPRTVTLAILDNSFATVFSEAGTFSITPGGNGSVTISFTANSSCRKIGLKVSSGSNVDFTVTERSGTEVDTGDVTTSLVINEPDGWKQAILKLARDKEFYSVIEFFDGSFIFYGDNGVINGGIHFIKDLEQEFGPDVAIEILIELAPDDENYETVFNGQLDLSLAEELPKNKIRIPIIRDNFWAKFNSRWQTPVDLQSATDLDGDVISEPVGIIDLSLPDQKITYFSDYNWLYSMTYPNDADATHTYLMLAFEEEIQSDIKLFSLVRSSTDVEGAKIFGLFEAPWDGVYNIQMRVVCAVYNDGIGEWTGTTSNRVRIRKTNEDSFVVFQFTGGINNGTDFAIIIDINEDYTLAKGEQLSIMLHRATSTTPVTVFGKTQLTWLTVELATTSSPITLSGEQTVDGVMTSSDRVLVKNQGNPQENGIYVSGAGAWTRATDMDTADEFNNVAVYVTAGDDQTASGWQQTEQVGTVGSDAVRFSFTEWSDEYQKPFDEVYDLSNYVLVDDILDEDSDEPGSFIKITARTVYKTTEAQGFLLHDAAAAILKYYELGEENPFYSELLGSALTNARQYEQDGCAWRYALLKGLQLRGYRLSEKPFFMSFEQWWKGINPILCLGLTYELIEGINIDVQETDVELVSDWADAGGPDPGTWDEGSFNYPAISVNGNGGPSGYTCGDCVTVEGNTYQFTGLIWVESAGANPLDITFTWAILDSSFNELDTVTFNYTTYGYHLETFLLTPSAAGAYLALKVVNDTVTDTKTVLLRYATSGEADQVVLNEEFVDSSVWTNEGAGTPWAIAGGALTLSLASGNSQQFTQLFTGLGPGNYQLISERTLTDITVPTDSINLGYQFYDEDDNLISSTVDFGTGNNTIPISHGFQASAGVAKIVIVASMNSGAGVDVEIPFVLLYGPTGISDVIVPDMQVIRVEERAHFYNPEMSALISNIENITRKYDTDKIYNKIEIGYGQWQSEDISGIDDTQTKQTRATRFQKIGTTIQLLSDFIAASLAIEVTRRQSVEKSKDYKFDNNTFIIAINPDDVSPDSYVPELDENFTSILNLLNSETRYNTRLSVARNFLRWRKWLNGCLQHYLNSFYKFVGAEGNFDMVSDMVEQSPDCLDESYDDQPLSEKQDIEVTDDIIHTPNHYEIEVPMEWETYKTIRENRKNAIGISLTETDHVPLFIDQLDYEVMNGKAKIMGWTKEYFDIRVIEGGAATQLCFTPTSTICIDAITDEFGEMLTDENGVCITGTDNCESGITDQFGEILTDEDGVCITA